jgi:aminopeptidase N
MQSYFKDWQFKHPSPDYLKKELETASGKDLNTVFELLNKEGKLF